MNNTNDNNVVLEHDVSRRMRNPDHYLHRNPFQYKEKIKDKYDDL